MKNFLGILLGLSVLTSSTAVKAEEASFNKICNFVGLGVTNLYTPCMVDRVRLSSSEYLTTVQWHNGFMYSYQDNGREIQDLVLDFGRGVVPLHEPLITRDSTKICVQGYLEPYHRENLAITCHDSI